MVDTKNSNKKSAKAPWAGRGLWIAAGIAVLVAILAVYQFRNATGFHWTDFFSTFVRVDWRWLTASVILMLLTFWGRAFRWEVMLRPLTPNPSLWNVTSATVIGFTAIVLLGRAGEVVRPYLISVKERVKFSSQMAAWILERIFDLLLVLLIFGIALARLPPGLHVGPALAWVLRTGGYFIATIGAVCLLLLVAFRNFGDTAHRRIMGALSSLPERFSTRIEKILQAFIQGMQCTRDPRFLALLIIYTILEWVVIVAAYYCMFRALPATDRFGLDEVMIFLGFVAFGSVVQVPGIGGGMQAASVLVLTEIFGISAGEAWGTAMLIWLLSWVIIVPFGLVFAHRERISWRRISHISEDVEAGGT